MAKTTFDLVYKSSKNSIILLHVLENLNYTFNLKIISLSILQSYVIPTTKVLIFTDDFHYTEQSIYCMIFASEYEKVAKIVKEEGEPYILTEVNVSMTES